MSLRARFRARLEDAIRVHVDARVLGFHLLGDSRYLDLTRLFFEGIRSGSVEAQTSAISVYQLLVEPHRRGQTEAAERAEDYLTAVRGLEVVPVSAAIAGQAARARAQLGGRSERSIQIATAVTAGADLYLTEGSGIRRVAGVEVANLEDYL